MHKHYDLTSADMEVGNPDMVAESTIRRLVREATDIPESLDIEIGNELNPDFSGSWFTQGSSGFYYVDGPALDIWTEDEVS